MHHSTNSKGTGDQSTGRGRQAGRLLIVQDPVFEACHDALRHSWDDVWFVRYDRLRDRLTHIPTPDVVLCPVIGHRHDVLDVAAVLNRSGFQGKLWCLGLNISRPTMISAEIRAQYPTLKFEILEPDAIARLFGGKIS